MRVLCCRTPDRGPTVHLVERAARAASLEAGRQRGLIHADDDDWDLLTEQERGGWRLVARAVLRETHRSTLAVDAQKLAAVLSTVDGGCPTCQIAISEQMDSAFPLPDGTPWLTLVLETT